MLVVLALLFSVVTALLAQGADHFVNASPLSPLFETIAMGEARESDGAARTAVKQTQDKIVAARLKGARPGRHAIAFCLFISVAAAVVVLAFITFPEILLKAAVADSLS